MSRLLVIGAGATLEECARSGAEGSQFPLISNFVARTFDDSYAHEFAVALYLDHHGIYYNPGRLAAHHELARRGSVPGGVHVWPDAIRNSPVQIFKRLERDAPAVHNAEILFEFLWRVMGDAHELYREVIKEVHRSLSLIFVTQFAQNGSPMPFKPMRAGQLVAHQLMAGDRVINLNYDVAFDVAVRQAGKPFFYSPHPVGDGIAMFKPHGSLNLFVNRAKSAMRFVDVCDYSGSGSFPDPEGGEWEAHSAIVPPRLNKQYQQHPIAATILGRFTDFPPRKLTFWGCGLTASDSDLLAIYRRAATEASGVEFINPSKDACERASNLLGRSVHHYASLEAWDAAQAGS